MKYTDFFTVIKGGRINPAHTFLSNFVVKYRQDHVKTLLHSTFYQQGSRVSVPLQ
jgi:hypothetical protein